MKRLGEVIGPAYAKWNKDRDRRQKGESKMPSYIKDTGGGDFEQVAEGTHVAVCQQVINLGYQKNEFEGETTFKMQHLIRFEVPAERTTWVDKEGTEHEGPMAVSAFWTSSLSEKSNMRKYLEAWRGKQFTPEELEQFDLFAILGTACQISVGRTNTGKAKITGVMALPKGMARPKLEGDTLGYDPNHSPETWDRVSPGVQKMCIKGDAGPKQDTQQVTSSGEPAYPRQGQEKPALNVGPNTHIKVGVEVSKPTLGSHPAGENEQTMQAQAMAADQEPEFDDDIPF